MKMPRTSAFSTAIRSSNDLIHLDPVNYQCVTSLTVGLNYLYKNSRYGRTKHGRGKTDEKGKYHPCPGEILARRYKILQTLSKQGQSGIILKAQDLYSQTEVTIKVLHVKYYGIGIQEAHLLSTLKTADPYHVSRTVRLLATFKHKEHYCMVFESLHPNPITELPCLTQTTDVTKKLSYIRRLSVKLLQVLSFLQQQNMIHADLKPENILLKDKNDIDSIRVIDFGNAIHHVHQEVSMYYEKFELQTLLYRAPEVMFGIPFGCEVDIWSLGCILVEIFLGTPLFLGENKTELIIEIVDVLGPLPTEIFQRGKFYKELSQYTSKHTIKDATLEILNQLTDCYDYTFANFLSGLLKLNPDERLTPLSALQHPFLASEFNMGVVLKSQGSKDSMFVLKPENYTERPKISPDIKRQNPTSYDLLQLGTTSESCQNIAVVCPFSKSKQGRVSVVPQVSAIPPLIDISTQRQAGSSIGNAPSVHGPRQSNQWNSAHLRRNRHPRSNMNLRRNVVQEEELSATSPNRIFTNQQRQHNPQTNAGPLDSLQSGSQSSYQMPDQNPSVSPTAEVYVLSTERQRCSEGDLTTASPRKIRRLSGHRNRSDHRLQMPLDPAVTVSRPSSLLNSRHSQINQVIANEFENVVSQNSQIGASRRRRDPSSTITINPRAQMHSLESGDVIEVDPISQTTVTTDPQSIELIDISDDQESEHYNVDLVPRGSLPSNHKTHIKILGVSEVSRIKSVAPPLTLDKENVHDVTIIEESENSDEPVLELIDENEIQSLDNSQTFLQQNHALCSNQTNMRSEQTHVQSPLCSSSLPIHESKNSPSYHHINTNTTSKQSSQADQNSSKFETIYSSLVQKSSKPDLDVQPSTSGEKHTRASSTMKRKKARRHASSPGQKSLAQESFIKTSTSSISCDPAAVVIKVEPLDTTFQEVPPCFLSPLKQEIKQEHKYEVQSNTIKTSPRNQTATIEDEQDTKDLTRIKEEIVDNEHQETMSRRSASEIKKEQDTECFDRESAPDSESIKRENESPTSRVPPRPCTANPIGPHQTTGAKDEPANLPVKIVSPMSNDVSQRSEVSSRRSRASSKALEPNFSGSHTPLAMEMNMGSADSNVYRSTVMRKSVTKVIAQTVQSPLPSSSKVSQSPRRVSKPLESEELSQVTGSPWASTTMPSPATVSGSPRQFHPKIISGHGLDSPLLPGREDSSSPESVIFSPQKLKRIENGTIYFEGFDKYISKRELSEKVIKILPESKPKTQRVYSSTESDLSESTASYIRKNMKARRAQLPHRAHSRMLKQPTKVVRGHSTAASDYEKATASSEQSSTGKKTHKTTSQYKEVVGVLTPNQRNHGSQKQKPAKRNVQNRAAVKRILKRWKSRKDSSVVHSSETDKHHSQSNPLRSKVSKTHMAHRTEQEFNEDTCIGISREEVNILEENTASQDDANVSPNLQEYSWNLLDRDAERHVLDKEWGQIARANNFFGSPTPVATSQIGNANTERPSSEVLEDFHAFEEEEESDQMTLYSPSQTPVISMTPDFTEEPASPINYFEISRSDDISDDTTAEIDAIPCTSRVKAEIRHLLGQGFELRPVSKPGYGTPNQRLRVNNLNDTVPYSPTQSPFVLTSTPDRSSIPMPPRSRSRKQQNFVASPSKPPLDSPRAQRKHKVTSHRFVDSGIGQSTSPKLSFKFKKPKSCMLNFKRRQVRSRASESESVGCSDLTVSEISSPEYNVTVSPGSSSSFLPSSDPDVAYSPSQEPVLASSQPIERNRKIRTKPKLRVSALNTSGSSRTDRHLSVSSRNRHRRIRDEMDVEPDVLGTLGQMVTPEREWQKNLRRRDTIPKLDRSDPNVALYGAFVYFAKKLS